MKNKQMHICIIDRFEGDLAVIEHNGVRTFDLPRELLPEGAKQGDVLCFDIRIDQAETERRQREVEELARRLFEEN